MARHEFGPTIRLGNYRDRPRIAMGFGGKGRLRDETDEVRDLRNERDDEEVTQRSASSPRRVGLLRTQMHEASYR